MPPSSTPTLKTTPADAPKAWIIRFWDSGYAYMAISLALLLIYTASPMVGILDWKKEIAYFSFIRQALTEFHSLPWFWWNKPAVLLVYPAAAHSSNFVANPESMLFSPFTPQILLVRVVPYIKFLSLLHWLIGIAGCLALRLRLSWGPLQFRLYLLLFLLSPLIIQHLAVGYTPWLNLYFFPWLIYFLADVRAHRRILGTAGVIAICLLQGGLHVALWFASILLIYSLVRTILDRAPRHLVELASVGLLTAWLAWIRVFSSFPVYAEFQQDLAAGYAVPNFLFWSLYVPLLLPALTGLLTSIIFSGVPAWDAALFWGGSLLLALVLVVNFGPYQKARKAREPKHWEPSLPAALLITAIVLLALSFDSVLAVAVHILSAAIPLGVIQAAEKYPFRFAVPAFLLLGLLIAEYADEIFASLRELGKRIANGRALLVRSLRLVLVLSLVLLILGGAISGLAALPPSSLGPIRQLIQTSPLAWLLDLQVPILTGLATAILLLWLLDSVISGSAARLEAAVGVPMILASLFWLSVGLSVSPEKYMLREPVAPNIITEPAGSRARVTASPYELVLQPVPAAEPARYILPRTDPRDLPWLRVASANAALAEADGRLTVQPVEPGEITVAFDTSGYRSAALVTLAGWIFVLMVLALSARLASRPKSSPA